MALRFTSLGSGSSGNALVVDCDGTRVMMDCGFAVSEVKFRLERVGLAPSDLAGILVTHEHDDHMRSPSRSIPRMRSASTTRTCCASSPATVSRRRSRSAWVSVMRLDQGATANQD